MPLQNADLESNCQLFSEISRRPFPVRLARPVSAFPRPDQRESPDPVRRGSPDVSRPRRNGRPQVSSSIQARPLAEQCGAER